MAVLTLVIPLAFRGTPLQLNLPFLGVSAALAAHYDFVADYLYGTTQFTFWVDKKTGKEAGGAWTRQTRWRKAARKPHLVLALPLDFVMRGFPIAARALLFSLFVGTQIVFWH
jgi:hypothetical protein